MVLEAVEFELMASKCGTIVCYTMAKMVTFHVDMIFTIMGRVSDNWQYLADRQPKGVTQVYLNRVNKDGSCFCLLIGAI